MTAAQLAGLGENAAGLSSEVFHQGMVVLHPEYGLGKIIALSGSGLRRTATVAFPSAGERKFVLAQSALQPVKASD
jgi:DNA helicase-2/ATP-dependent DNA helicase PcrA